MQLIPTADRCSASKRKQVGRTVEAAGVVLSEQDLCEFSATESRVRGGSQIRHYQQENAIAPAIFREER